MVHPRRPDDSPLVAWSSPVAVRHPAASPQVPLPRDAWLPMTRGGKRSREGGCRNILLYWVGLFPRVGRALWVKWLPLSGPSVVNGPRH